MTAQPPRDQAAILDTGPLPYGTHVASSPHHLASDAATSVMKNGGNAADGAIAANAVLSVVSPDTCGPGGDLFALIYRPGDDVPRALNASGRAGSGAMASSLREAGLKEIPARSPWTITVPGCVDGWEALINAEGSLAIAEALAPAIDLAGNGFAASVELAESLRRLRPLLKDQESASTFYPEELPPKAGTMLKRPMMAATLQAIAAHGRDSFYSGAVGNAITRVTSDAITAHDLQINQAEWVTPIGLEAFGLRGWTIPPNSQGYVTLAAAWIFDQFTTVSDHRDPSFQHGLIEAYRSISWEAADLVSDPVTAPLSSDALLAPVRLSERLAALDPVTTATWPNPGPASGGTAFMCTRDASGMGVALIQSNYHGIGSALSAGNTGVFLHDRGAGFTLEKGHPNELKPGKRPLHTLSPTLWTRGNDLAALLGTRGGALQPQYLLQVAANLFRAHLSPAESQHAPRWQVADTSEQVPIVSVEPDHGDKMARALSARGHETQVSNRRQPLWGPVSLITVDEDQVVAAADPRVSTASVSQAT